MSGVPMLQLSGKKPLCTLSNCRSILGPYASAPLISCALFPALHIHVAINTYFRTCFSGERVSQGEGEVGVWDFAPRKPPNKIDKDEGAKDVAVETKETAELVKDAEKDKEEEEKSEPPCVRPKPRVATMSSWPLETVVHAVSYLDCRELIRYSSTNRTMRRIVLASARCGSRQKSKKKGGGRAAGARGSYARFLWWDLLRSSGYSLPKRESVAVSDNHLVLVAGQAIKQIPDAKVARKSERNGEEQDSYLLFPWPEPEQASSAATDDEGKECEEKEEEKAGAPETVARDDDANADADANTEAVAGADAPGTAAEEGDADDLKTLEPDEAYVLFRKCYSVEHARVCPHCLEGYVVPVVYGFPSPALLKHFHTRELKFGGDYLLEGLASWSCVQCERGFYSYPYSCTTLRCAEPESQQQSEGYSRKMPWSFGIKSNS